MSEARANWAACLLGAATLAGCLRSAVHSGVEDRPPGDAAPADHGRRGDPRPLAASEPGGPPAALALIYSGGGRGQVLTPGARPPTLGGLARRATLVDRARLQAREVFQVDTGDFLPVAADDPAFAAPALLERRTRLVLAAYERMDVDVVTLGARELQLDPVRLRQLLKDAKQPVVLANVLAEKSGLPVFPTHRVRWVGERKIGAFGLVELAPPALADLARWKLKVTDPVAAARAAVAAARAEGAALVVGLFNLLGGAARAQEIAAAVPGIDVVVYAGPGAPPATGAAGGPLLVAAPDDGTRLGRIDAHPAGPASNGGGAPALRLDNRSFTLDASVPDQLGVSLLLRADTTAIRGLPVPASKGKARAASAKPEPVVYEIWTYGSGRVCVMCHKPQAEQWQTTEHARAMASLKRKGRDRDPFCVGCHADAFLQPGGTVDLDTVARAFGEVGCESCHGPSVAHVRSPDKKKGTSRQVDALVCLGCHTPDQSFGPFDYARAVKEIIGPGHGQPPVGQGG